MTPRKLAVPEQMLAERAPHGRHVHTVAGAAETLRVSRASIYRGLNRR
jgi:hypothetical protein